MTMKKILDILDKIEVAVASLVLLVLICVTFFGVLMRYIFNNPFTWEEELQLACMVWITFLAAPAAFRTSRKTPILMIPYSTIYAIAPVSIVLMLISYTEQKYYELKELFKGDGKEEK